MKKYLIPALLLLILLCGLSTPAAAVECDTILPRPAWPAAMEEVQNGEDLVDAVADAAVASYLLSKRSAGRSDFHGWCGLMTSHQLYNLGINKSLVVNDGNNQFDYYSQLEVTTGGYFINSYSSNDYTLEGALNAVTDYGNKDVFNVLVGFQWTHTEAGSIYGHAVLINGIIDGYVYFVESYDFSFGTQGSLLTCTIPEFVKYFDKWTLFDGIIHFGEGAYSDVCPTTSTDLMIQARFPSVLRSQPSVLGKKGAERIRDVSAGEKFRAIAICRDTRGAYYKVLTNQGEGFISVGAVSILSAGDGEMVLSKLVLPNQVSPGKDFTVGGTVAATHGRVAALELCLFLRDGTPARKESIEVDDRSGDLSGLNGLLYGDLLEPDVYIAEVYAYSVSPVAGDVWGQSRYQRVLLHRQYLVVGETDEQLPALETTQQKSRVTLPDGWIRIQGVDYYRRNGQYLTGWQRIDGKQYYFSATGAMCKGWLTLDGRTWYLLEDGTGAVGQLQLDGSTWMFGATGILLGQATK